MFDRNDEPSTREFRRRALRFQKHRLSRKSPIPLSQRLLAWLMMLLSAAIVLVMICQR